MQQKASPGRSISLVGEAHSQTRSTPTFNTPIGPETTLQRDLFPTKQGILLGSSFLGPTALSPNCSCSASPCRPRIQRSKIKRWCDNGPSSTGHPVTGSGTKLPSSDSRFSTKSPVSGAPTQGLPSFNKDATGPAQGKKNLGFDIPPHQPVINDGRNGIRMAKV